MRRLPTRPPRISSPRISASLISLALLASCGTQESQRTFTVDVIDPRLPVAAQAQAQGLVRYNAEGQIVAGLAERWLESEDGKSLIFRIARTKWSDGKPVLADEVARSLNASFAAARNSRLGDIFTAVEAAVPMTGRVVELHLKAPRPHFLQLLAQPELAIHAGARSSGAFRFVRHSGADTRLEAVKAQDAGDDAAPAAPRFVLVHNTNADAALARFVQHKTDVVLGGGFNEWPLLAGSGIANANVRIDPVSGLFGVQVVRSSPLVRNAKLREALNAALEREALGNALGLSGFTPLLTLLPNGLDLGRAPTQPLWAGLPLKDRRAHIWGGRGKPKITLRVALPEGVGAGRLFAALAEQWQKIGVGLARVPLNAAADLVLLDEVAPDDSASFILTRLNCVAPAPCNPAVALLLSRAKNAASQRERAAFYAQAEDMLVRENMFLPLGNPYRWSLAADTAPKLHANASGWHPLDMLR
jgi:oligopeptide transport system substrate-binding protein